MRCLGGNLLVDVIGGASTITSVSQETVTGTPIGGDLDLVSSGALSALLKCIIVRPATGTTTYQVGIKETTLGVYFLSVGRVWTGTQRITLEMPLFNDTFTVEIRSASVDEAFNVDVRYL